MFTEEVWRPGLGTARQWRAYGRFHAVPSDIACAGLVDQLNRQVSQRWTGFLLFEDGRGVCMPSQPDLPMLPPDLWNQLRGWAEGLNRHVAEDGHWVVAWDHDEAEARLLYRDGDGDLQVVIEINDGLPKIQAWTLLDVLNQAAKGLSMQRDKVRQLGADRPTIRLARGEKPH